MQIWRTARFALDLTPVRVMGIVNCTPDSFSDGGQCASSQQALSHAEKLLSEGADILDIGAESSRPGAQPVDSDQEWQRLEPVLQELLTWGVPISVDTYKSETMRRALDMGVDIINDIWGFRQPGALDVVTAHPDCGLCIMHMHGEPSTMQIRPIETDAVKTVLEFLASRVDEMRARSVDDARLLLDPGIGFGKTVEQNFALLAQAQQLNALAFPWMGAWSRKSALGAAMERQGLSATRPDQRIHASVAIAMMAVERGARVLRVHDVAATLQGLAQWRALCAEYPVRI